MYDYTGVYLYARAHTHTHTHTQHIALDRRLMRLMKNVAGENEQGYEDASSSNADGGCHEGYKEAYDHLCIYSFTHICIYS